MLLPHQRTESQSEQTGLRPDMSWEFFIVLNARLMRCFALKNLSNLNCET